MSDSFNYQKGLFVSSVDGLVCGICGNVLNDPHQCKNGHLYCLACIQRQLDSGNAFCGTCGIDMSLSTVGSCLFAKEMINRLIVKCKCTLLESGDDEHCDWTGPHRELKTRHCEFIPEGCPNRGCDEIVIGKQKATHAKECHFRQEQCGFCKATFVVTQLIDHSAVCEQRPIKCDCDATVPFVALPTHKAIDCPLAPVSCPMFKVNCCADTCTGSLSRRDLTVHVTEVTQEPEYTLKLLAAVAQLQDTLHDQTSSNGHSNSSNKRQRVVSSAAANLQSLKHELIPGSSSSEQIIHSVHSSSQDAFSNSSHQVVSPLQNIPIPPNRNAHEVEMSVLNDLFNNSDNEAPDDASLLTTAMSVEVSGYPQHVTGTAAKINASSNLISGVTKGTTIEGLDYVYEGQVNKHKQRHGHGVMRWLDGVNEGNVYEGNFNYGTRRGQGRMTYANGDIYTGEWLKDLRHGHGVMLYGNGEKYDGEWQNNTRTGNGDYTYLCGDTYSGSWDRDRMHGEGTYTWITTGDSYEGTWVEGQKNGQGVYRYTSGDMYQGTFKNDLLNGEGMMTYCDGRVYTGMWRNGYQHGKGVMKTKGGRGRGKGGVKEEQSYNWGKRIA